jgi:hypothetical protein
MYPPPPAAVPANHKKHQLRCLQITQETPAAVRIHCRIQPNLDLAALNVSGSLLSPPPRGTFSKTLYFPYCLYFHGLAKSPEIGCLSTGKQFFSKKNLLGSEFLHIKGVEYCNIDQNCSSLLEGNH